MYFRNGVGRGGTKWDGVGRGRMECGGMFGRGIGTRIRRNSQYFLVTNI